MDTIQLTILVEKADSYIKHWVECYGEAGAEITLCECHGLLKHVKFPTPGVSGPSTTPGMFCNEQWSVE